jgi:hypothetical protein
VGLLTVWPVKKVCTPFFYKFLNRNKLTLNSFFEKKEQKKRKDAIRTDWKSRQAAKLWLEEI